MSVIYIISLLFILGLAFQFFRHQRKSISEPQSPAPPQPYRALFEAESAPPETEGATAADLRAVILARAAQGDLSVLGEARNEAWLYQEALNALVEQAGSSSAAVESLIAYLMRDGRLRANARLARALINLWQTAPGRKELARLLYIAALADDAETYQAAVNAALQSFRAGQLPEVTANELLAGIESHYWLMSVPARASAAGFTLRHYLADARSELLRARRRASA